VPKNKGDKRSPDQIPDDERDYFLERIYPSFGNLVPRDVASRNAKIQVDAGRGVGETGVSVYLDFRDSIKRLGANVVKEKYGNLFDMYQRITDEDPYKVPMRIYPAVHYTMGGLWVDYNLMSTIPGLFVLGEANFSDHGANRLGASALMQGLADGYFVIPYTIGGYLAEQKQDKLTSDHAEFEKASKSSSDFYNRLLKIGGKQPVDHFHKELGKLMWEYVGMGRSEAGLKKVLSLIPQLRQEFWRDVKILGEGNCVNTELEKAGRVADFLEQGELMALDALERKESCGGHFREESQTPENEAKRDDENFCHVAAWEFKGDKQAPVRHKEELKFEYVKLSNRSYK
jgi:succinate dehydrogenase / fumarate reductase flavoprotein subunit